MAFDFPAIDPVAFSIGPLVVRWYALAYLGGFLLGWRYALYLVARSSGLRPNKNDIDDFIPWAIIGVIAGGRFGYILFYNFEKYSIDPLEILKVWHGGMSFHGGAAGVIIALIVYSLRRGFSPLRLADIVCCAVPIGLFLGRIANFINGELYGRVTDVWWAVKFPAGGYLPRHPSQIYEAVLEGLVLFIVLFLMARAQSVRNRPGVLSGVFLIGYSLSRIAVEFLREPDAQIGYILNMFTMGQILSLPLLVFGIALIINATMRHDRRNPA